MELHDTNWGDVEVVSDLMIGYPKKDSRGVRVRVLAGWDGRDKALK